MHNLDAYYRWLENDVAQARATIEQALMKCYEACPTSLHREVVAGQIAEEIEDTAYTLFTDDVISPLAELVRQMSDTLIDCREEPLTVPESRMQAKRSAEWRQQNRALLDEAFERVAKFDAQRLSASQPQLTNGGGNA